MTPKRLASSSKESSAMRLRTRYCRQQSLPALPIPSTSRVFETRTTQRAMAFSVTRRRQGRSIWSGQISSGDGGPTTRCTTSYACCVT
ncbi:unnamed protein product [Symbiodinium pilosum]|uniref:Uncharacterized protein n=1 Tax=Symbiodinium pilosum TaxID=2952 RepID=A0A812KD46_SYMPI|nr:unnamed protein product [Symbiodinium pilosum]